MYTYRNPPYKSVGSFHFLKGAFLMPALFCTVMFFSAERLSAVNVTFQVDMSQMVVSPNGVHLAGDFQGWDPATFLMTDLGSGIFSITVDLPPGTYQFKFINGNSWGEDELVPNSCGIDGGLGVFNREIVVSADVILPAVCFAQCDPCEPASFVMNGNAMSLGGDCYAITPPLQWQNGAFWSNAQIDLNDDFDLQFNINLGVNDTIGADGVVFVLQALGSNVLGASGGGMGYSSFGTSFGIEFDTYENSIYTDPAYDHLSMEINGDVSHYGPNNISWPVQMSSTNVNTEDGLDHIVGIYWNASTQIISVFFDCVFRLQAQYDLVNGVFGGQSLVFWGFTGATGAEFNQQTICAVASAMQISSVDICPGSSTQLNSGVSIDGIYNWSPISYLDDPTIASPTASPPDSMVYEISYHDLCNVLVTKQIAVNVLNSGAGCFLLPVSLADYSIVVADSYLLFEWTTTSEQQNDFFTIESSVDGRNFDVFEKHTGAGYSQLPIAYYLKTSRPYDARYYRLLQTDFNGRSAIISSAMFVPSNHNSSINMRYNTMDNSCRLHGLLPGEMVQAELIGLLGNIIAHINHQVSSDGSLNLQYFGNEGLCILVLRSAENQILFAQRLLVD